MQHVFAPKWGAPRSGADGREDIGCGGGGRLRAGVPVPRRPHGRPRGHEADHDGQVEPGHSGADHPGSVAPQRAPPRQHREAAQGRVHREQVRQPRLRASRLRPSSVHCQPRLPQGCHHCEGTFSKK